MKTFSFLRVLSSLIVAVGSIAMAVSCGSGDTADSSTVVKDNLVVSATVKGKVTVGSTLVSGAKVYLVPVDKIDFTPITMKKLQVKTGGGNITAEDYDEPLEDAVRLKGSTFFQAETNSSGQYSIASVTAGTYYVYADPGVDSGFLPGGDKCRVAVSLQSLADKDTDIELSGKPSSSATYVGSSSCLECHADHAGQNSTAHHQGISVPGKTGGLQNTQNFPYFNNTTDLFIESSTYAGGTVIVGGDPDAAGFGYFELFPAANRSKLTAEYVEYYLWKTGDDFKITVKNLITTTDPNSLTEFPVKLTYGGTVYKQRFVVKIPKSLTDSEGNPELKGHYMMLQYQGYPGISEGNDAHHDSTRRVWRDYHFERFWNKSTNMLASPSASKNFELNCASCHFTGFKLLAANSAGELLADAVDDPKGAYDIDGDGKMDEVNIGCEMCHGPGSEHSVSKTQNDIVSVNYLTSSRANMICEPVTIVAPALVIPVHQIQ